MSFSGNIYLICFVIVHLCISTYASNRKSRQNSGTTTVCIYTNTYKKGLPRRSPDADGVIFVCILII